MPCHSHSPARLISTAVRKPRSALRNQSRSTRAQRLARLNRLARALTVQEAALAIVWNAGGRVFTADTGEVLRDHPDDPMRTALRQVVGVFAELDRRMVVKRLKDDLRCRVAWQESGTQRVRGGLDGVAVTLESTVGLESPPER